MERTQLVFIALFSLATTLIQAQDRHFSQFYASPLTLNPALTGSFEGKYRVGINYRSQWAGMLPQPFKTSSLGADLRLNSPWGAGRNSNDKIGAGLLFVRDNIPVFDFSTTQVALSTAYHKALGWGSTQYLSLGFQMGLSQRNVIFNAHRFQDQWNGVDGFSLPSGERLPENNFGYTDLSTGLNYTYSNDDKLFIVGVGYHHFNRPNVAFVRSETIEPQPLAPRYSLQLASTFPITRSGSIMFSPRVLTSLQGQHLAINAGANFRFRVDNTYGTSLHLGAWFRPVRNVDGINLDALVIMSGIEYNNVLFGVSYDLSLPTLAKYRRTANVFEFSLIYLGEYDNDELLCPTF
jgi:type IX secretion system PorP/SprF family membrane protein